MPQSSSALSFLRGWIKIKCLPTCKPCFKILQWELERWLSEQSTCHKSMRTWIWMPSAHLKKSVQASNPSSGCADTSRSKELAGQSTQQKTKFSIQGETLFQSDEAESERRQPASSGSIMVHTTPHSWNCPTHKRKEGIRHWAIKEDASLPCGLCAPHAYTHTLRHTHTVW